MTTVASANMLESLTACEARRALADVLALEPDLIGLQEWYPTRLRILSETGRVGFVPDLGLARGSRRSSTRGRTRGGAGGTPAYLWNTPMLGGCAVGARADRFELVQCRTRLLSRPGLADREPGRCRPEPGRVATVAVYRDLRADRTVSLVDYHLVSGVQSGGDYRTDRPLLVARHHHEREALQAVVADQLALGHVVYATGDSNYDGFRIEGLTSAWPGREDLPGTLGPRRKVDDVHGPVAADSVTLVVTGSDHRAVVVGRPD
jgi:hypothetical protein